MPGATFHRWRKSLSIERGLWCRLGFGLLMFSGAFAFSVWVTVRSHPEQDLPLWPAWIFSAIAIAGLALLVAGLLDGRRRTG